MKTVGISAAGGVGQGTAETIVNGYSQFDMYELDMSRFLGLHNNRRFLRDRVKEVPGMLYICTKYSFIYSCISFNSYLIRVLDIILLILFL